MTRSRWILTCVLSSRSPDRRFYYGYRQQRVCPVRRGAGSAMHPDSKWMCWALRCQQHQRHQPGAVRRPARTRIRDRPRGCGSSQSRSAAGRSNRWYRNSWTSARPWSHLSPAVPPSWPRAWARYQARSWTRSACRRRVNTEHLRRRTRRVAQSWTRACWLITLMSDYLSRRLPLDRKPLVNLSSSLGTWPRSVFYP